MNLTTKNITNINKVASEVHRKYIEGINLVNEISDLTKEIDRVGNVILYLRGDKWRI